MDLPTVIFVIPEIPFGSLGAMIALFIGLGIAAFYKKNITRSVLKYRLR